MFGGPEEVTYGVYLIRTGIRDYRSWSEWMVLKYGESIREKLSGIYGEAEKQAVAVDAMEQDSHESLGPSVWKPLEDAAWSSDAVRENEMLPLRIAYSDLSTWHRKQLKFAVEAIAIFSVREILASIERLPKEVRDQCRSVNTTKQALEAANKAVSAAYECWHEAHPGESWHRIVKVADQMGYAAMEAAWGAMRAASALEESASAVAKAADAASTWGANPDEVLRQACAIWIEAAHWAEGHIEKTDGR